VSRIVISDDRCKGCGLCTLACPYDLVHISERFNAKGYRPAEFIDPESRCTGCTSCAAMCPDVAIVVYRTVKSRATANSGMAAKACTQVAPVPQNA